MNHTPECIAATERYKKLYALFVAAYPNHCTECGGSGYVTWTENQAPLGSGHYWPMQMTDICESCIGEGKCPLCGKELHCDEYTAEPCIHCGWNEDLMGVMTRPPEPECFCWCEVDQGAENETA